MNNVAKTNLQIILIIIRFILNNNYQYVYNYVSPGTSDGLVITYPTGDISSGYTYTCTSFQIANSNIIPCYLSTDFTTISGKTLTLKCRKYSLSLSIFYGSPRIYSLATFTHSTDRQAKYFILIIV